MSRMDKKIFESWDEEAVDNVFLNTAVGENIDMIGMKGQECARYKQNTNYRKYLALWVMIVVSLWLFLVMLIVFLYGFDIIKYETSVINILLATTTVNVLGLAYIVLKGLYGNDIERIK